ncbi:hypothetical protein [Flavobacterium sp. GNP001]
MKTSIYLLLFGFSTAVMLAQDQKLTSIRGLVVCQEQSIADATIRNSTTGQEVKSNSIGSFSVLAKTGDELLVSAFNYETVRKIITAQDLLSSIVKFELPQKITVLPEVIIRDQSITARSIGAQFTEPKRFTAAERKLQTAGDFKPIMLLGLLGGSMPLDPLINKINGRTKRLKVLVALEKKEQVIKLLSEWFEPNFYTDQLQIPSEFCSGFKFFVAEEPSFVVLMDTRDKNKIAFELAILAVRYKSLLGSRD